jgi:hypothetical protein
VSVSAVPDSNASVTAIKATWGRYGTDPGAGAHCASTPATSGPSANPSVIATAARRAALCSLAGSIGRRDSSRTQAVPALKIAPLLSPASSRPANSNATLCPAAARMRLATSESAAAGITTTRRPLASDSGPASSSPGTSPSA